MVPPRPVTPAGRPPPVSPDADASLSEPPRLPVQLTSFIGREKEIASARHLLAGGRLLTLTGAGGSGKTRLSLEVAAREAAEGSGGVAWVELAALTDPTLLPQEVATTLGLREEAGRSVMDALVAALRNRPFLLLLDNCEHLADACAALVDTLLRGCPELRILATSREALGVSGERAWLVPPLSLPPQAADPPIEDPIGFEAVQLFVARAQDVAPDFTLSDANAASVVQICQRLDGIPLAIELAAARVKVLTPDQIAQRLDNVFALLTSGSRTALPRHRTLRAAIDWSYRLLGEPEQRLLQRLSVFSGGFTLEAAECVCADEGTAAWEVLDLLARLVDRSLVVMQERDGAARYHLLETVRQFAAERFARCPDADATRRRHAAFYLDFAEAAEPHVYMGGTGRAWLYRVDAEIGNLRAAADWFAGDEAGADPALRLATALRWYWYQRDTAEGRAQIDRALARAGSPSSTIHGCALVTLGTIAFWQGDIDAMHAPLAEGIRIGRAHADDRLLAEALNWDALGRTLAGDVAPAWEGVEEALELARRIGGPLLVQVTSTAGYVAHRRGELDAARSLADEATRLAHALGMGWAAATVATNLARLAYAQGDLDSAAAHWHEGLGRNFDLYQRWAAPFAVEGLALVAFAHGDAEAAARLLGGAEVVRATIGTTLRPFDDAAVIEEIRASLGDPAFEAAFREGRSLSMPQAIQLAAEVAQRAMGKTRPERMAPATPTAEDETSSGSRAPITPAATPLGPSAPPALRVLALGPLEIFREGEPLPADAWTFARPRELLLSLLCRPEGRTREQIGLLFWPDSSRAQVKNSFHVALHHLRKVLGNSEWVIVENDRYRINPALSCEFDAALFAERMTLALRDARAGSGSIDRLRAVLDLYRGDFLQDESVGDWHLETRDHLGRLYREGLSALGRLLVQAEQWSEATVVYQKILLREDLDEDAHRGLMLSLARAGERSRALRHYERLVGLLKEELDAEPEQDTTELYEHLRQASAV